MEFISQIGVVLGILGSVGVSFRVLQGRIERLERELHSRITNEEARQLIADKMDVLNAKLDALAAQLMEIKSEMIRQRTDRG